MSTKHTPGPWRVGAEQSTKMFGHAYAVRAISNDDGLIAAVRACTGAATAALIAAAPDMLAALRQLERAVSAKCAHQLHAPLGIAPEFHDLYAQVVQARAALAKAEKQS